MTLQPKKLMTFSALQGTGKSHETVGSLFPAVISKSLLPVASLALGRKETQGSSGIYPISNLSWTEGES